MESRGAMKGIVSEAETVFDKSDLSARKVAKDTLYGEYIKVVSQEKRGKEREGGKMAEIETIWPKPISPTSFPAARTSSLKTSRP